eukprot:766586-Hanusia_phi.AAC.10
MAGLRGPKRLEQSGSLLLPAAKAGPTARPSQPSDAAGPGAPAPPPGGRGGTLSVPAAARDPPAGTVTVSDSAQSHATG